MADTLKAFTARINNEVEYGGCLPHKGFRRADQAGSERTPLPERESPHASRYPLPLMGLTPGPPSLRGKGGAAPAPRPFAGRERCCSPRPRPLTRRGPLAPSRIPRGFRGHVSEVQRAEQVVLKPSDRRAPRRDRRTARLRRRWPRQVVTARRSVWEHLLGRPIGGARPPHD
jgi:hypothetical protein